VRDPVERVISWYYYIRAPWYYVERKHAFPDTPLPDPNWLKKVKKYTVILRRMHIKFLTDCRLDAWMRDCQTTMSWFCFFWYIYRTLRLVFFAAIESAGTRKERNAKGSVTTGDRPCSFADTTRNAREYTLYYCRYLTYIVMYFC